MYWLSYSAMLPRPWPECRTRPRARPSHPNDRPCQIRPRRPDLPTVLLIGAAGSSAARLPIPARESSLNLVATIRNPRHRRQTPCAAPENLAELDVLDEALEHLFAVRQPAAVIICGRAPPGCLRTRPCRRAGDQRHGPGPHRRARHAHGRSASPPTTFSTARRRRTARTPHRTR